MFIPQNHLISEQVQEYFVGDYVVNRKHKHRSLWNDEVNLLWRLTVLQPRVDMEPIRSRRLPKQPENFLELLESWRTVFRSRAERKSLASNSGWCTTSSTLNPVSSISGSSVWGGTDSSSWLSRSCERIMISIQFIQLFCLYWNNLLCPAELWHI